MLAAFRRFHSRFNATPWNISTMTQTIIPLSDSGIDIGFTTSSHEPARELSAWRLLAIGVPANWQPTSWISRPPGASPQVPSQVACAMAVLLNARRMQRGRVRSWTVRIKGGTNDSSWLSFELPADGWQPTSPYDIPPCATEITAYDKAFMKGLVEEINASNGPTQRTVIVMPLEHTDDLFSFLPAFIPDDQHADELELVAG